MKGGTYIFVVLGILLAKALGFCREIVFASVFGASEYTDIYFQIFSLASLVFTGVGSALSTLIIKNLNRPENSSPEAARAYTVYFFKRAFLWCFAAVALLYLFAGPVVRLLLPGISDEAFPTAVKVMYIMLPSCLFIVFAYIMNGVLQNSDVFFITSIMSLPFNVLIISSLFVKDISITAVSVVTTIGWFSHILILLPAFYKRGNRFFVSNGAAAKRSTSVSPEVVYIFIAGMMFQACFMIDKAAVSFDSGAATTLNYASNLFLTISSVFVVSMCNVIYPSVCMSYENNDKERVRKIMRFLITLILCIFLPFILTVCCFGRNIVSLLYEHGEFGPEQTFMMSKLFMIYTFGIFGYVCQEIFNKILYLGGKYRYAVIGTVSVIALKLIADKFLAPYGAVYVAVSTSILFTLYAFCIFLSVRKVVGDYFTAPLLKNVLKVAAAGAGALAVHGLVYALGLCGAAGRFTFLIEILLCSAVYLVLLKVTGVIGYVMDNRSYLDGKKNITEELG
ncbi:MAG: hypothetical protein J5590_03870 [Clostridia bacterium]|nr:hypothetical protein [Clostridia bacterium]